MLNIVHGGGGAVGDRLVKHPDVRVITLTGSRETGVEVMRNAAEALKHVHLELGGKNAIIVLDDADLELAVEGILWSAFGTSGQRCTAASRVIVQDGAYEQLQSKLVEAAEKMRLGAGWEDDTDVGPVINKRALEKIHSYTGIGKDEGAKLLTGGEVASDNGLDKGFFYRPTIFGDVDPQMRVAQEEIFGPTTALIRVRDVDEAIRVSNGIKFGLSSSIFTRDVNKAFRAMRDLEAGITYINAGTIGAEVHLPFGGTKDTGNGHREAGQAALDVFTEWKSIYVDYSGKLQKAQIDTDELKARLSTDGGARGNPGPAAFGYVLEADDGHVLAAHGEAIGRATNNVAEYSGLVAGMAKAAELGVRELEVVSDSELLVKQMRGEYRVKNEALKELWEDATDLERKFAKVRYTAVRRAHNELADRLVNEALDAET